MVPSFPSSVLPADLERIRIAARRQRLITCLRPPRNCRTAMPPQRSVDCGRVPAPDTFRRCLFRVKSADDRFGSLADIAGCLINVRFTPESGHGSSCDLFDYLVARPSNDMGKVTPRALAVWGADEARFANDD